MGFPSIKTAEALAATYGVDVQARTPSHSVLGVQPDDMREVLKKWVGVCRRGAWFPRVALHRLCLWLRFVTSGHLLRPLKSVPGFARKFW